MFGQPGEHEELYSYRPKIETEITANSGLVYVSYSPDQSFLCSAGVDRAILTDLQTYKKNVRTSQISLYGHDQAILSCSYSPKGCLLATSSIDRTIRIWKSDFDKRIFRWNVVSGRNHAILRGHRAAVHCVRWSRDSRKVISCSGDKTIRIWDVEKQIEISVLKGCEGPVFSIDILPDNHTIVSGEGGFRDGTLRIWDARSPDYFTRALDFHTNVVNSVQFHPNTFSLASGSDDSSVKVSDIRNFRLIRSLKFQKDAVSSVCFHPTGRFLLFSGCRGSTIYDLVEQKTLHVMESTGGNVQFSPDGKGFAIGCRRKALLWTFPFGRQNMLNEEDDRARLNFLIYDHMQGEHCESEMNSQCYRKGQLILLKIRKYWEDDIVLFCYKSLFSL